MPIVLSTNYESFRILFNLFKTIYFYHVNKDTYKSLNVFDNLVNLWNLGQTVWLFLFLVFCASLLSCLRVMSKDLIATFMS